MCRSSKPRKGLFKSPFIQRGAAPSQPPLDNTLFYPTIREKSGSRKPVHRQGVVSKGIAAGNQSRMKRTSNYLFLFTLTMSFAADLTASYAEAKPEPVELPGGFELESSLDEAQQHASSRGWQLVRLSPELPGQWEVAGDTGAEVGLFVCGDTVTSVHQYKPGDLDEFARIVTELRIARRQMEPAIQVVTFMAGAAQISNVDVKFAELGGIKVKVQLSSTGGRLGISTNYSMGGECQKP